MQHGEVGVVHHPQNIHKMTNFDLLFLERIPLNAPILNIRQRPLELVIPRQGSPYQLVPGRTGVLENLTLPWKLQLWVAQL